MIRFATMTAAALALTATAAVADPYSSFEDEAYDGPMSVQGPVYDSPSEETNYQFQPGGASTAPGFAAQNDTHSSDWTPNQGAGTSKSNNANQG